MDEFVIHAGLVAALPRPAGPRTGEEGLCPLPADPRGGEDDAPSMDEWVIHAGLVAAIPRPAGPRTGEEGLEVIQAEERRPSLDWRVPAAAKEKILSR